MSRIEWAAQRVAYKKTRLLTQLVAVLEHSRRCSLGDQINNVSSPIMPIPITSTANATGS